MKRIMLSGIVLTSILLGEQLKIIPMDRNLLSQENGGSKSAIDAYSDGIGIVTESNQVIDNSPMNILVYTYGEKAKESGDTLKNFSLDNGNNKEVILAEKLGQLGTELSCDDGDVQTINDKYVNGVCIGTNVEGQTCDDGNVQTINDKYLNGICVGTNVEGQACDDGDPVTIEDKYVNGICKGKSYVDTFKILFENGTSVQGGEINLDENSIKGYRTNGAGVWPKGYESENFASMKAKNIKQIKIKVDSQTCGVGFLGTGYNNILLQNYNFGIPYATYNIDFENMTANVSASYGIAAKSINLNNYDLSTLKMGVGSIQAGECWQKWYVDYVY